MFQEKSSCQEKSMLKRRHHGCSEFSERLDIIDCTGNCVLMEKMGFFANT